MVSLDSMAGKSDVENSKLKETFRSKIKLLEEQVRDRWKPPDAKHLK